MENAPSPLCCSGAVWRGTGEFPTLLPPAKAFLQFKAGCEGNEAGGKGGLGGFAPSLSPNSLCKAPCNHQAPPDRHLGGGTGKRSSLPPAKRGRITQKPPQSPAGRCQHRVTGCPQAGIGAQWR